MGRAPPQPCRDINPPGDVRIALVEAMTLRGGVGQLVKLESENGALKREMVQQRQQMAVMADNLAYLQKRQVRARVAWRDGVLLVLRGDTKRCSRRRAATSTAHACDAARHPSQPGNAALARVPRLDRAPPYRVEGS